MTKAIIAKPIGLGKRHGKSYTPEKTCLSCGIVFKIKPCEIKTKKYCSRDCKHEGFKGKKNVS